MVLVCQPIVLLMLLLLRAGVLLVLLPLAPRFRFLDVGVLFMTI